MNKTTAVILWPLMVLVFMIGWVMYWAGYPQTQLAKHPVEAVTIGAITLYYDGRVTA